MPEMKQYPEEHILDQRRGRRFLPQAIEIRCKKCERLLFKTKRLVVCVEIKCSKCGYIQNVSANQLTDREREILKSALEKTL
jgi:phage FluMu protein Com